MKNHSKFNVKKLAEIYCAGFDATRACCFDRGVRVGCIIPLELATVDRESVSAPLRDWIIDGDIDELLKSMGFKFNADEYEDRIARFLSYRRGYIIQVDCQSLEFNDTTFDKKGEADGVECFGWGAFNRYYGWVDWEPDVDLYVRLRRTIIYIYREHVEDAISQHMKGKKK